MKKWYVVHAPEFLNADLKFATLSAAMSLAKSVLESGNFVNITVEDRKGKKDA